MATIIGVGMQMTASAAGMTKGLSEADRALQLLQKIVEQNQKSLQQFGTEATKTNASLDKLTSGVSVLSTIEIGRVLVSGLQAIASAFTSAAQNVLSLASNVSQSLDSLNDLSARTGIGVEALQGYSLAAKMAGVDVAEFGAAIQRLGVNIGKADPGGAFEKSLQGIGLTLAQLRGLNPEAQFAAIGEAISRLPTAADRAAAAVEIFGRQGAALAPLFREGAASIDELRERAERLGVIVSETQVNNVAAMNDAFDLVRATVEGIIGQVIGNLAPAVTDVANQFLEFIETFQGADGTGGTGIANAITDVLLQGAEQFARVFDFAVEQFGGFGDQLLSAADVFGRVGQVFLTVGNGFLAAVESLRAVFNIFELAGNALMVGLGNFLAGIGSWVSSGLRVYGEELARAANEASERNARELEEAAANSTKFAQDAAAALNNVFTGGADNAELAGQGAAVRYIKGMQEELARGRLPEVKVLTGIEASQERLQAFLKEAGEGADAFFKQSEATLEAFQKAAEAGSLTSTQVKVMLGFMDSLNGKLDEERTKRQAAADAAKAQAEADGKRIEGLLRTNDAAQKVAEDLAAVERERQRVAASQDADAASRLGELDALRGRLLEQQQALAQGFGDSFADEFLKADEVVAEATRKAAEFGDAGAQAAAGLAQAVKEARLAVDLGLYSKEKYDEDIRLAQDFFNRQLEAQKKLADERRKVNEFVDQQLALQAFDGDSGRLEASRRVLEIEAEIARVEAEQKAARQAGDDQAVRAATSRLAQLDQVASKERDIATGAVQAREEAEKQLQDQQQQYAKAQEDQQKQIQQAQQAAQQELARQQQAEYERQVKRITELNTLGSRTVQTADVRTQEGAALVLNLAANAQDPALIEARLQSKYLKQINENIQTQARRPLADLVGIVGGGFVN